MALAGVVRSCASQTQPLVAVVDSVKMRVPAEQAPLALKLPAALPPSWVLIAHVPLLVGADPPALKAEA